MNSETDLSLSHSAHCPACLALVPAYLGQIVAERDREKLSRIFVTMVGDVFQTEKVTLFRHLKHRGDYFVVPLASIVRDQLVLDEMYFSAPRPEHAVHESLLLAQAIGTGLPYVHTAEGMPAVIIPVVRDTEVHQLLDMVRKRPFAAGEIALAETLLSHFHDHLALIDYAETDTLTGLLNRKTFDEHLDRVLSKASADDGSGGKSPEYLRRKALDNPCHWLAIIDIDHFKRVNDAHGHLIGDEVLLLVAQLMQDSFRFEDQLFRFGGEEFVAVLQPTDLINAQQVLERFRQRIEAHAFPIVGPVSVSLGFTIVKEYDNPTDLIDRADKALYHAKQTGRNRVENFESLESAGLLHRGVARKTSDVELF